MRRIPLWLLASLALLGPGCARPSFVAARATRPYPVQLERVEVVDVQVFREGVDIDVVNASARKYEDVTLWVNRRYALDGVTLPAGKTKRLSLWSFYDQLGEVFNAGGFFRTRTPTPLRLVEIDPGDESGLIGLITIRAERLE